MWIVTLHLPGQPERMVAMVPAPNAWAAQALVLERQPLLPPDHLRVNGEPLPPLRPPDPGPTPGQILWRERRHRQRMAERHRARWAGTHTTPPPPKR